MITRDHDHDWQGLLAACAIGLGYDGLLPSHREICAVLAILNGTPVDIEQTWNVLRMERIACRLGINERRSFEWHEYKRIKDLWCTRCKTVSAAKQSDGTWKAQTTNNEFCVVGHPTVESAIEHIERLLGQWIEDISELAASPEPVRAKSKMSKSEKAANNARDEYIDAAGDRAVARCMREDDGGDPMFVRQDAEAAAADRWDEANPNLST